MAGISDDVGDLRVNRDDFMLALEEVHPAFGVSEEELQAVIQNGIIHYDEQVEVCPAPLIGRITQATLFSRSYRVHGYWWNKFEHLLEHHSFQFCYTVSGCSRWNSHNI
jgi:hypothetical protein